MDRLKVEEFLNSSNGYLAYLAKSVRLHMSHFLTIVYNKAN
jgi:hypothetical protein